MALTAAHCIDGYEDGADPGLTVRLADGETYEIRESRANECFDYEGDIWTTINHDIALMILDRPIPDAVEGRNYLKTWNAATMGNVIGK